MANGKIRFGKQLGGELALVIPNGATDTEVIVPESGILATEQYVDDSAVSLAKNQTIGGIKTFISTVVGNISGNAGTATKLQTARTINGVAFDGSVNITLPVSDSTAVKLTGDQTIAGVKTFSSNPISTATQSTSANALTRKDYVDTKAPIASPTFTGNVALPATTSIGAVSSTELGYLDGATSNIQTQLNSKLGSTDTAAAATKLATPRTINGVAFDGSANITISGSDSTAVTLTGNQTVTGIKTFSSNIVGSITGNSATATKLSTARTINGVAFDGTADIVAPTDLGITAGTTAGPIVTSSTGTNATLPTASATASGVVTTGSQTIAGVKTFSSTISGSVNGNAGTATKLATARTINGVSFDGSANITVSDNTKQDTLVSGTNIKTINSSSILSSGNLALLTSTNPAITGSITEQVYNLTGTAINPTNGTIQYKTVSANTTFTESLTSGQSVLLRLINANSYTITFPTITWVGATAPTLTANCAIVLWKEQSTLYGAFVGTLV